MNAKIQEIVIQIETELDRLDAYNEGQGIVCAAEGNLPAGWVRVYDGTGEAYGPGEAILAALKEVEYDADEIVRIDETPIQVGETDEKGFTPFEVVKEEITADADGRGFELAWDALGEFADSAPNNSRDWPSDLIAFEQIEEGTCNDQPNTLISIQTNGGDKFACGPHGVSECALSDAFRYDVIYSTRKEAVASCEVPEVEEV